MRWPSHVESKLRALVTILTEHPEVVACLGGTAVAEYGPEYVAKSIVSGSRRDIDGLARHRSVLTVVTESLAATDAHLNAPPTFSDYATDIIRALNDALASLPEDERNASSGLRSS